MFLRGGGMLLKIIKIRGAGEIPLMFLSNVPQKQKGIRSEMEKFSWYLAWQRSMLRKKP
jgi:hypothetical protein